MNRLLVMLVALALLFSLPLLHAEEDVRVYYEKGMTALQEGDHDTAIVALSRAVELRPDIAQFYNALGVAHLQKKEYVEDAIEQFEKAVALKEDYGQAYINLGLAYTALSDLASARLNYEKAAEVEPGNSRAHFGLGWISLTQESQPRAALPYLEEALRLEPENPEYNFYAGMAAVMTHQLHKALKPLSVLKMQGQDKLAGMLEEMIQQASGNAPLEEDSGLPSF